MPPLRGFRVVVHVLRGCWLALVNGAVPRSFYEDRDAHALDLWCTECQCTAVLGGVLLRDLDRVDGLA